MNKMEKSKFIDSIVESIRQEADDAIDHGMPDYWNGIHIRRYLVILAQRRSHSRLSRAEIARFNNEIVTNNL